MNNDRPHARKSRKWLMRNKKSSLPGLMFLLPRLHHLSLLKMCACIVIMSFVKGSWEVGLFFRGSGENNDIMRINEYPPTSLHPVYPDRSNVLFKCLNLRTFKEQTSLILSGWNINALMWLLARPKIPPNPTSSED